MNPMRIFMNTNFAGHTVLITGGTTGIGYETAKAFVAGGARRVYITGRNADRAAAAAKALGETIVPVAADAAKLEDIEALAVAVKAAGDTLDVVFANAGIAENNAFGQTGAAEFARTFDINVRGVFFTVQTLLPVIRDGASIVLNASIVSNKGMPNLSLYNASKAAVRSFARSFASDLKPRRIRVNAVSPGVTMTPIMENGLKMSPEQIAAFSEYVTSAAPSGRTAHPKEIAAAVLFLASDAASYVNGVELSVDGGLAQV